MQAGAVAAGHALPFSSNYSSCSHTRPHYLWATQIRAFKGNCLMPLGVVCPCKYCRIGERSFDLDSSKHAQNILPRHIPWRTSAQTCQLTSSSCCLLSCLLHQRPRQTCHKEKSLQALVVSFCTYKGMACTARIAAQAQDSNRLADTAKSNRTNTTPSLEGMI